MMRQIIRTAAVDPERFRQVEELYHSACKIEPSERGAFLARACQGDEELRREVESLLAQDDPAGTTAQFAFELAAKRLADSTATRLSVGSQLGPYRIEGTLGAGGMGMVFRALDTRLNRPVAVKFLSAELADAAARRRFQREAQLASSLNHPHILTVHDAGEFEGQQYLVTEYIDGGTLKDWARAEERTWRQIVELLVGVADGLATAHDAKILHRDIKPANILVTKSGYAKLADFGLAKLVEEGETGATRTLTNHRTQPGVVIGTIAYMSPEQASGQNLDARSDIFSFAIVLYEAFAGTRPFQGATDLEVLQAIIHSAARPLRGEMPEALRVAIGKGLEKDRERRYQSMREMVADLRMVARGAGAGSRRGRAEAAPERLSVAVLPFRLLATAPEEEFLSAALADAVVNRLAATGRLLVRPTASVIRYAQSPTDWRVVARELNVDLVVEATIQKLGQRLRVLIAAYRVIDSVTLHSAKHDGTMDDLFGFQDQIAEAVCAALAPQLPKNAQPARPPTRNALAYELYLRSADRISRWTKWDVQTAIETLSSATALDPNFADAWARLAQACIHMGVWFDSDPRWLQQAETAIARSQELDTVNSDAFCAQGQLLWTPSREYKNRPALRALNAALKINPGCHQAQIWRGLILHHLGLYVEACQVLEEALAASPRDMLTLVCLGQTSFYRGDYEEAYDFYARAVEADPVAIFPRIFLPTAAVYMEWHSDAIEKLKVGRQMAPDEPTFVTVEGIIAAREGDFARAEELADASLGPKKTLLHTHHLWHYAAAVFTMCGKPEKALPLLHRCADMGLPNYRLFGTDPHLRALHNRPEFLQFMAMLRKEHEQYCQEFGTSGMA